MRQDKTRRGERRGVTRAVVPCEVLWGSSLAHDATDVDEIIGDHAEPDPALHSGLGLPNEHFVLFSFLFFDVLSIYLVGTAKGDKRARSGLLGAPYCLDLLLDFRNGIDGLQAALCSRHGHDSLADGPGRCRGAGVRRRNLHRGPWRRRLHDWRGGLQMTCKVLLACRKEEVVKCRRQIPRLVDVHKSE